MDNNTLEKTKPYFTSEQSKILAKISDYFSDKENVTLDQRNEISDKLEIILKEKNLNPYKYILWHKIIGSTQESEEGTETEIEFDTPNRDIEKFLISLKK